MSDIIRIIKRDFSNCWSTGINLHETRRQKVRRVFWMLVYLAFAFRVAFRGMRREQLGSTVVYRGRKVFVSNWAGSAYPTLASSADGFYETHCDRREIRSVRSVGEYCHRFIACFGWWMGSWFGIAVNKRLYP